MKQLTKRSNSILAQDAQKFLDFMALPDGARRQEYPTPSKDHDGYKIDDGMIPRYQLRAALPISSPWGDNKDCMSGVICVAYNSK